MIDESTHPAVGPGTGDSVESIANEHNTVEPDEHVEARPDESDADGDFDVDYDELVDRALDEV